MRHLCSLFIVSLFIFGCATPQPTLVPTQPPPSTAPEPSPTPPRSVCVFRNDANVEVGVYRFIWTGISFKLNTRAGILNIHGDSSVKDGLRQLILIHNKPLPESFGIALNTEVGQTLILDPQADAQEVRDVGGAVIAQSVTDVAGKHGGLPPYLDIVKVEREFGYFPNTTVKIYLAQPFIYPQVWNAQFVGVTLGKQSFTYKRYADGIVDLLETDALGRETNWSGTAVMQENVVTFKLQAGWDQAAQAYTRTSAGAAGGTDTVSYPQAAMKELWDGARKFCP